MTTTLPKGSILLAESLLADPAQYKSVSEIMRASHLLEKLETVTKKAPRKHEEGDKLNEWVKESVEIEITDAQKVLLYNSVERNIGKIPASVFAAKLGEFLGFES